jgi:hypothetical protein
MIQWQQIDMQFLQWQHHTYGRTNDERYTDIGRAIYGVGAGRKQEVHGRIDVGARKCAGIDVTKKFNE